VIFLIGTLDAKFQAYPLLWGEAIAVGFWVLTVGYYFLMFTYLFLNRYAFKPKEEQQIYWLSFSLFFIFSAVGRVFHVINDFFVENPIVEKMGVGFQWFSFACMAIVVAELLIENESIPIKLGYVYVIPPIVMGVMYFIVPPDWIFSPHPFYFVNIVIVPIYAISILVLFFWMAYLIPGQPRINALLNGIGFTIWFAGRFLYTQIGETIQSVLTSIGFYFPISITSSSLIIISLILFAYSTKE